VAGRYASFFLIVWLAWTATAGHAQSQTDVSSLAGTWSATTPYTITSPSGALFEYTLVTARFAARLNVLRGALTIHARVKPANQDFRFYDVFVPIEVDFSGSVPVASAIGGSWVANGAVQGSTFSVETFQWDGKDLWLTIAFGNGKMTAVLRPPPTASGVKPFTAITGPLASTNQGAGAATQRNDTAGTATTTAGNSAPGNTAANDPPLNLQGTTWFCTVRSSRGEEIDGFLNFQRGGTVKQVESARRGFIESPTSFSEIWLFVDWKSPDQWTRYAQDVNSVDNVNYRWASTTREARFIGRPGSAAYSLRLRNDQLVGTWGGLPDGLTDQAYIRTNQAPGGLLAFDVPLRAELRNPITCSRARGWLQR
jgi:hypothetical protein